MRETKFEGMGLDWKTQHRKIMAHPVLSKGIVFLTIPTPGGPQEMVALPLSMLGGWLMTVNANMVGRRRGKTSSRGKAKRTA
jgi:P22_AR N-terminal domain